VKEIEPGAEDQVKKKIKMEQNSNKVQAISA